MLGTSMGVPVSGCGGGCWGGSRWAGGCTHCWGQALSVYKGMQGHVCPCGLCAGLWGVRMASGVIGVLTLGRSTPGSALPVAGWGGLALPGTAPWD